MIEEINRQPQDSQNAGLYDLPSDLQAFYNTTPEPLHQLPATHNTFTVEQAAPEAQPLGHEMQTEIPTREYGRFSLQGLRQAVTNIRSKFKRGSIAGDLVPQEAAETMPTQPAQSELVTPKQQARHGSTFRGVIGGEHLPSVQSAETPPRRDSLIRRTFDTFTSNDVLAADRRTLQIDASNRSSDWIQNKIKVLNEAFEVARQNNPGKAQAIQRELMDLEDFHREGYDIQSRLGFMNHNRGALALRASDERAQSVVRSIAQGAQLGERAFVDGSQIKQAVSDPGRRIFIETGGDDTPLELPLANFVSAENFSSWEGRKDTNKVDERGVARPSTDVVQEYANRGSEGAPPIERVQGYIQPNGMIIFATGSGSHRTAAAVRRGDQTIKAKSLVLQEVDQDFIPLPNLPNSPDDQA